MESGGKRCFPLLPTATDQHKKSDQTLNKMTIPQEQPPSALEAMLVTPRAARTGPSVSSFSSRGSFTPGLPGSRQRIAGSDGFDDGDEESPMFERNEESSRQWSLGNTETRAVKSIRRLVFVGMSVLSLAVAGLVYFLVRESEVDSFEDQYREDASKVLQSFALTLELTMGNMDVLALSIASYARGSNQTWPYVTVADFGSRAEKARALTHAVYMNLYMHVLPEERYLWEAYSAEQGPDWVADIMELQERQGTFQDTIHELGVADFDDVTFWNVIHDYDEWEKDESEMGTVGLSPDDPGPFLPMWQTTPMIPVDPPYNWDLLSTPFNDDILAIFETHKTVFSETYLIAAPDDFERIEENEAEAAWVSAYVVTGEDPNEPMVDIYYPIIADSPDWVTIPMDTDEYIPSEHRLGGLLSASIYWRDWIKGILSEGNNGLVAVWRSPCNPSFTYEINGPSVRFLGVGDFHESRFNDLGISTFLEDLEQSTFRNHIFKGIPLNEDSACPFSLHLYPSSSMEDEYLTHRPVVFCGIVLAVFGCSAIAFLIYDHYVERRNRTVMQAAERTDAIVSNLLPAEIRDRLYRNAMTEHTGKNKDVNGDDEGEGSGSGSDAFRPSIFGHGPLAELYPSATVVFCDMVGFAAWASTREPQDVFQLLEDIYSKWDKVAHHHGVFKIETVGDCYTAVAGLPNRRDDHVVAVARFARDILSEWSDLTKKLEIRLGPDTTNLAIRVGCHTGPVTAGILRGTMTRYQLFGDTVNTAERMQCTSEPGWAQLSTASANMLKSCGKERWIRQRTECIDVQGKGSMETYWLLPKRPQKMLTSENPKYGAVSGEMATIQDNTSSEDSGQYDEDLHDMSESELIASDGINLKESTKLDRLVEWNSQVLADLLKVVLAARDDQNADHRSDIEMAELGIGTDVSTTVLDEFEEIIELPAVTAAELARRHKKSLGQELDPKVVGQLRQYLHTVATMYRENPFHNFEHATHVTASVQKLLSRIVKVNTNSTDSDLTNSSDNQVAWKDLVGHSYGITSDPLTQFAVVLSAVIHDCDHPGVPNAQLVKEGTQASHLYKQKSIAEQNSVDLCWQLLMEPDFQELRGCIYQNQTELHRFRQLIVNTVMATDIVDKELQALRKARWNAAFSGKLVNAMPGDDLNRKATIVIEHLIQASDVCHTMQHWDIYVDWNERFFMEQYGAFMAGRSDVDPSLGWYKGEIGFFDYYVIPLAKKLYTCGVFGVTSHEFLDYAQANRNEWVSRGKDCVAAYIAKFHARPAARHKSK